MPNGHRYVAIFDSGHGMPESELLNLIQKQPMDGRFMRRMYFVRLLCIAIPVLLTGCSAERDPAAGAETNEGDPPMSLPDDALSDGERIVFFGDSITQAGVEPGGYVVRIDSILENAYPGKDITVIGAGISGNKVPDLLERLDRDVLARNPTLVVIYIGINDVWHWFRFAPLGTEKPVFESGLRTLISRIRDAGARVVLCTPSVIGEHPAFDTDEDKMLDEYAEVSRHVASDTGVILCDLREAFVSYLVAHNTDGPAEGVLTRDGVHLNQRGNRFVAREMAACITTR